MLADQQADTVVVRAPAKVNLFLEVLGKRPDGYHDIVTFMVAVELFDILAFKEETSGELRLTCDEATLSVGPDNLVWRAAELLRRQIGVRRGARIHLSKRIPQAAGLAGGSSDAAATLIGLDRLWRLKLSNAELMSLAAQLGSDVPFFFSAPAAWCTGRGEQVTPFPLPQGLHLVLACPAAGLTTAAVYRAVTVPATPHTPRALREALIREDVAAIGAAIHNRLQPVAERLCPAVAALRQLFTKLAPAGHGMSGSGSSYFALCHSQQDALALARQVRQAEQDPQPGPWAGLGLRVYVVRSLSARVSDEG
jgi:4-diphosphocytidyl-2-C-methyl-D-erythritol kinase